jgi:epoxyqueuosine reductase
MWDQEPHGAVLSQGPVKAEASHSQGLAALDLLELVDLTEEEFRSRFRGTPILRAKRVGLQRNACVALGNLGDPVAIPALSLVLTTNPEQLVRGHAAWALGEIGTHEAEDALKSALAAEAETDVLTEISMALDSLGHQPATTSDG